VDLARRICKAVGLDVDETVLIVRGLVRTYLTRSQLDATNEATVEAIAANLEKANKTKALNVWNDSKTKIVQALDALNDEHALVLSLKAEFVAGSRPNILISMRLFTDARPVFNEAGDRVLFNVIGHTLSLEYREEDRRQEIHLSLDGGDIAQLFELCMQADAQAAALKASVSAPGGRPFEIENE
jgi:hypothetical protein